MRRAALLVVVVLVTVITLDLTGFANLSGLTRAGAQTGGGPSALLGTGYDLTWNTIDNGGGSNGNGGYTLNGTIGQPDAGAWSGGGYALAGGFWIASGSAGETSQHHIYLPLVLRGT